MWKQIVYKNSPIENYEINETGEVRSLPRDTINKLGRTQHINGGLRKLRTNGNEPYLFVDITLTIDGKKHNKSIYIHRAVYETFIKSFSDNNLYITHKDNNTFNNHVSNLRIISHSELQKMNMIKYPENRQRLKKHNLLTGYYKKLRNIKRKSRVTLRDDYKIVIRFFENNKTITDIVKITGLDYSKIYRYIKIYLKNRKDESNI